MLLTHLGAFSLAQGAGLLAMVFWHGMIIVLSIGTESGQLVSIDEALQRSLSRFWAGLGTFLLGALLIMAFTLLLVVPGFMAMTALCVAFPACIVEGCGPTASLGRAAH